MKTTLPFLFLLRENGSVKCQLFVKYPVNITLKPNILLKI